MMLVAVAFIKRNQSILGVVNGLFLVQLKKHVANDADNMFEVKLLEKMIMQSKLMLQVTS
jgi:hypothetical protein